MTDYYSLHQAIQFRFLYIENYTMMFLWSTIYRIMQLSSNPIFYMRNNNECSSETDCRLI